MLAALHEPEGCGGGSANTYCFIAALSDLLVRYLFRSRHEKRVGIGFFTEQEEHLAVAGLLAAYEEDYVVLAGEVLYMLAAVRDLAADSVFPDKLAPAEAALDFAHQFGELIHIFGGLGEEVGVLGKVQTVNLFQVLDDDSGVVGLALEPHHFGVAGLAENHYLAVSAVLDGLVLGANALLQVAHHRAGGIDNLYRVALGSLVGGGRFTVGAEEYFYVVQFSKLLVVNRLQTERREAVHFTAIVYDIAQAVERTAFLQFFLCFVDSSDYSKAET